MAGPRKALLVVCAGVLFAGMPAPAVADSILPSSLVATLPVGGSVTITKTVTVSAGSPTTAQGDVFFLSDTTGSMSDTIAAVRQHATSILAGLSAYGNIRTGVGEYKDFPTPPWGESDDQAYRLNAAIDGADATKAGIDQWVASGGFDEPESQLHALTQVATSPSTGWRPGSERFVLWFGDQPGHEPGNTAGYPGPAMTDTIAALQAAGITVLAFDLGNLDLYGQATAITSATAGQRFFGYGSDITSTIVGGIGSAFSTYAKVDIEAPSIPGLGIAIVPLSYQGPYDRSVERTFSFGVTFTGLAPGTYTFDLFGRVDGGRVATEHDVIEVTTAASDPVTPVPEPATLLLLGVGLLLGGLRLRHTR